MIRYRRVNCSLEIWLLGGEQKGLQMNESVGHGRTCRRLMRRQAHAALATSLPGEPGACPYVSLVAVACDIDASPLLLLSDLAQHSRNIAAEPRISLLFEGDARFAADPLAEPRFSLLGQAARLDDKRLFARFVARHPGAAVYAGFGDFHLYRVTIGRGHLVAGFGRISWVEPAELRFADDARALAEAEADIITHMNTDHANAVALYATRLLRRVGEGWRMTGIDPEGIDLRCDNDAARLDFADHQLAPVLDAEAARGALVALVAAARHAPDE
jgi:heme iron utilization protein